MADEKKLIKQKAEEIARMTADSLRGKQSVRATFRLTENCIDAISIVAKQLGIKQKSLFDLLVEDTEFLEAIAREKQYTRMNQQVRVQKTFVISRRSLFSLDTISRDFEAPRDVLVEYSVQRLLPILEKERKKHQLRKAFMSSIDDHFKAGKGILKKIHDSIGPDDPMFIEFKRAMNAYAAAKDILTTFMEKSEVIEAFDVESMAENIQS